LLVDHSSIKSDELVDVEGFACHLKTACCFIIMKIECPYEDCKQRIEIGPESSRCDAACPACNRPFVCPDFEDPMSDTNTVTSSPQPQSNAWHSASVAARIRGAVQPESMTFDQRRPGVSFVVPKEEEGVYVPKRPLKLRLSYRIGRLMYGLPFLLAGILVGGYFFMLMASDAKKIIHDHFLWSNGEAATQVIANGTKRTQKSIFYSYDIGVRFADKAGLLHEGQVKFDTVFGIPDRTKTEVRYDPANPGDFVLSWAIDVTFWRWGHFAFMSGAWLAMAGFLCFLGWRLIREAVVAARYATVSQELHLWVLNVTQSMNGSVVRKIYEFKLPEGKLGKCVFDGQHEPLFVDAQKRYLIALRASGKRGHVLVLRNDFYPFRV
jgi:hypothetical protein